MNGRLWKKLKTCLGVLTGNMLTGYVCVSITTAENGRTLLDVAVSPTRLEPGKEMDMEETIYLPTNTVVFIPKMTEGRVETPDEYRKRTSRNAYGEQGAAYNAGPRKDA